MYDRKEVRLHRLEDGLKLVCIRLASVVHEVRRALLKLRRPKRVHKRTCPARFGRGWERESLRPIEDPEGVTGATFISLDSHWARGRCKFGPAIPSAYWVCWMSMGGNNGLV